MSKKRAPAKSSTVQSPAFGASVFGSTTFGALSSSATLLSYAAEPPDLSDIPDSQMVVLFKNLSKKDEKTKAKALEELQGMLDAQENVGDSVIGAWVKLYPRLSVDVSRRVRQLANSVLGCIGIKSGKRIAKHMPILVGPWLAGLYDSDTTVSRAAADSLVKVFKAEDKLKNIWKLYESTILDYCNNIISNESVYTLSDERSVSPDDAEAKYARVMATAVMCATRLISILSNEGPYKHEETYQEFVRNKSIWKFAYHPDQSLRSAVYRALLAVLDKHPEWVETSLDLVSTAMISKALAISQIGSVEIYLEALIELTRAHPSTWKAPKKSKKAPFAYLAGFLENGSQLASPTYWKRTSGLFAVLPEDLLKEDNQNAIACVKAIMKAVQKGAEPRTHIQEAWRCYFDVVYRLHEMQLQDGLIQERLAPFYAVYVKGDNQLLGTSIGEWAKFGARGIQQLGDYSSSTTEAFVADVWTPVEALVVGLARSENTQDLDQEPLKKVADNWVQLTAEIIRTVRKDAPIHATIKHTNSQILSALITSLEREHGKNIVLAEFFENLLRETNSYVLALPEAREALKKFFTERVLTLLDSPAAEYLLGGLVVFGKSSDGTEFQDPWRATLNALLISPLEKDRKEACIRKLIVSGSQELRGKVSPCDELDGYVVSKLNSALIGYDPQSWVVPKAALGSSGDVISESALQKILVGVSAVFKETKGAPQSLENAMAVLEQTSLSRLLEFVYSTEGSYLISKLLFLSSSEVDVLARKAAGVLDTLTNGLKNSTPDIQRKGTLMMADGICKSVQTGDIAIPDLCSRADSLSRIISEDMFSDLVSRFLFTDPQWTAALSAFTQQLPNVSLAITNPLAGSIYLIEEGDVKTEPSLEIVHDASGYSSALRMAMFSMEYLGSCSKSIPDDTKSMLLYYFSILEEIAKDNLTVADTNLLWQHNEGHMETEILAFLAKVHQWISTSISPTTESATLLSSHLIERLINGSAGSTSSAFYAARALGSLMSSFGEQNECFRERGMKWLEATEVWNSDDVFLSCAMLVGFGSMLKSTRKQRVCNELISALSGTPAQDASSQGIQKLVLLNSALPSPDEEPISIPQTRVIYVIKHMLEWFDEDDENIAITPALITEAFKALGKLLPLVKEMYGEHWTATIELLRDAWTGCFDMADDRLPLLLSSLKLFQTVRSMIGKNDDLDEAWVENKDDLFRVLLNILSRATRSDTAHQPLNMCYVQLARQLKNVGTDLVEDVGTIYPLLATQSRAIQQVAFDILHLAIPKMQEVLSIEAALNPDIEIQLPAELLSMIITAPEILDPSLGLTPEEMLTTRGYLLSWVLIYDQFQNSSFKVRSIYVDALKEGKYLPTLLDFVFPFLCPPGGRPVDASKLAITQYTPNTSPDPATDLRWLLTHIYYLSVRFTPSLAKSWKLECKNRATVIAVEQFTERYISPLLIDHELTAVAEWVQTREADDEDMQIKVSKAVREVTAIYPVDDQTMEMVVKMPANFPLEMVTVEGVRRVGLDEQHFRKLLLASQAVVNFQSGSIIDALSLFRKNVSLHFQGVAECAICYSILAVTPDRALPNRGCSTCKNKFHSTCLLKWFKTSNSSSCPLCRTSFSFYS